VSAPGSASSPRYSVTAVEGNPRAWARSADTIWWAASPAETADAGGASGTGGFSGSGPATEAAAAMIGARTVERRMETSLILAANEVTINPGLAGGAAAQSLAR